jgi:hypothetical protein
MSKPSPEELAREMAGKCAEIRRDLRDSFWNKVDLFHGITDEDCWKWKGAKSPYSYPAIWHNKSSIQAYRVSWILNRGDIPPRMEICHKCDMPSCVNPSHLFVGTHRENLIDCAKKNRLNNCRLKRTHCPHGHKFTPENTYVCLAKNTGRTHRRCRKCIKAQAAKRVW